MSYRNSLPYYTCCIVMVWLKSLRSVALAQTGMVSESSSKRPPPIMFLIAGSTLLAALG